MPTYEYQCDSCEHNFDEFQSMSEEPLTRCPQCGKKKLRRMFGPGAAIIFKGSGFYQTDYRSDSYKSAAKADEAGGTPSGSEKGASGTSDKKAASDSKAGKESTSAGAKSSKSKGRVSDD